jgi:phospholipid/cholesterol/gamma-HCH transport system substrate-binding protein
VRLSRLIKVQLTIFIVVSVTALSVMAFSYLKLPAMLFGAGHYTVALQLPETAGLYGRANVTYLGTQVGLVKDVRLTDTGVAAELSLSSDVAIPSNLQAQVHSTSPIGEQYVSLAPRDATSPPLRDGDVIPVSSATVPVDINRMLDATNRGLEAIPGDNLQTVIDESYTAFGGLGPEISRIVNASTALSAEARRNLDPLTTLIDQSPAVLDSQTQTADALHSWAANLASATDQLRGEDNALSALLPAGARAAAEGRALFDRVRPTVPIILANLVSLADVAVTYQANIEQLLVLFPANVANLQGIAVANVHNERYKAANLQLALNLNLPPPCQTGFLPPQQARTPAMVDAPDRPVGDLYCRVPQDSPFNVRGARNIGCETKPGKRAPTVKMCESDENYVPLNDGYNWKGDPNATLSGQDVPQLPPGTPPRGAPTGPATPMAQAPGPPLAITTYDPASGSYVGPDGKVYVQSDLAENGPKEKTWQSMLTPPS